MEHHKILPVSRADELALCQPERAWLIESLWSHAAVGIIGGAPKSCKSWLGIDMALSVASGTPCLGRFAVKQPGPAMIFLAEDALPVVRTRIEALCSHRKIPIQSLDLFVITSPSLRLDLMEDQQRLNNTLAAFNPRILLLDPLVRLHRLDENSALEISNLLGYIREMQRVHGTAIVLVHHLTKKRHAQPGQALRGSSDLHAFGDSNAYLIRRKDRIILSFEHRAAKAPEPITLELTSQPDSADAHLEIVSAGDLSSDTPFNERILNLLRHAPKPMPQTLMRTALKCNNQRLGQCLAALQKQGDILKTSKGWVYNESNAQPEMIPAGNLLL